MSVRPVPVLAAGYAVAAAGLTWYALVAGTRVYASTGDAYPGALTAVAEPLGYFTATLAGALCLGGLLFVVVTSRPDARGVIDEHAFRGHLLVERASAAWAFVATAMVVVQAAADAGAPALQLVGSGMLTDAVLASEMARAWVAVAVVAVLVAVAARMSVRWITHVVLLLPALVGVVALPVSGNAGQGPDHDYATSSAIVFAVAIAALVGVKVAAALQRPDEQLANRLLLVEITTGALVLGYGASMLAVLLGPAGPTGSGMAAPEPLRQPR